MHKMKKKEKKEERNLPSVDLFPVWIQQPSLGQVKSRGLKFCLSSPCASKDTGLLASSQVQGKLGAGSGSWISHGAAAAGISIHMDASAAGMA